MNNLSFIFKQLNVHSDNMREIVKLEKRCAFHEMKCKLVYTPYDKQQYRIIIRDAKFFSIDLFFDNETFDDNMTNLHHFIDSWILRNAHQ